MLEVQSRPLTGRNGQKISFLSRNLSARNRSRQSKKPDTRSGFLDLIRHFRRRKAAGGLIRAS